ncbi:MAG: type II toxin-antitoxin system RelE/ParE family toxin [Rhodomicrobium sp.]
MAAIRLSALAEEDIVAILRRTHQTFGEAARLRYETLLAVCLRDIAIDRLCPGSAARPEIGDGVRTCHLRHGRARVAPASRVRKPRHFLLYRAMTPSLVGVGRVLHDAMDVERHVPAVYGDED